MLSLHNAKVGPTLGLRLGTAVPGQHRSHEIQSLEQQPDGFAVDATSSHLAAQRAVGVLRPLGGQGQVLRRNAHDLLAAE